MKTQGTKPWKPNSRQRQIIEAMKALGGKGTMHQIAAQADFDVNGISQSLSAFASATETRPALVKHGPYKGPKTVWELIPLPEEPTEVDPQLRLGGVT